MEAALSGQPLLIIISIKQTRHTLIDAGITGRPGVS